MSENTIHLGSIISSLVQAIIVFDDCVSLIFMVFLQGGGILTKIQNSYAIPSCLIWLFYLFFFSCSQ